MRKKSWRNATALSTNRWWVRVLLGIGMVAIAVAAFAVVPQQPMPTSNATSASPTLPAPDVDEPIPTRPDRETIVLAGGCFWGVQGLFQHVKGVSRAEAGYAGGSANTADYESVSSGTTGHAESVRITYDPTQVTLGQLLRVFFSVAHDPTQADGQGADVGPQYRSVIFAQDASQQRIADSYIAQLNRAAVLAGPIATTVVSHSEFYPAEEYHQDYMDSHPTQPYVASVELPKLTALQQQFPRAYREQPVLMRADRP